jgi:hypothetical protein
MTEDDALAALARMKAQLAEAAAALAELGRVQQAVQLGNIERTMSCARTLRRTTVMTDRDVLALMVGEAFRGFHGRGDDRAMADMLSLTAAAVLEVFKEPRPEPIRWFEQPTEEELASWASGVTIVQAGD